MQQEATGVPKGLRYPQVLCKTVAGWSFLSTNPRFVDNKPSCWGVFFRICRAEKTCVFFHQFQPTNWPRKTTFLAMRPKTPKQIFVIKKHQTLVILLVTFEKKTTNIFILYNTHTKKLGFCSYLTILKKNWGQWITTYISKKGFVLPDSTPPKHHPARRTWWTSTQHGKGQHSRGCYDCYVP